jgi:hypothetical protein
MTNGEIAAFYRRFQEIDNKLADISLQLRETNSQMMTRAEYNESQEPLLKKVAKHEKVYTGAIKGLMWLGAATLVSAIVSPHWSAVVKGFMEFFK